jgi:predicted signal transduction protein with EAL and GGDEF domain
MGSFLLGFVFVHTYIITEETSLWLTILLHNYTDLIADRFVIFVADYRRKEELAELARGIVKIFDRPLSVSDNEQSIAEQYIDIQISIAEIKESCLSADRLLQDATLALDYINKNYSEQICFYEDIMEMSVYRQDRIEKALRAAINKRDNSSLYLQYQPKMSLKDTA